jgi:hypothetical protein
MSPKCLVMHAALLALAVSPASASASTPTVPPPRGDNYLDPLFLPTLKYNTARLFTADTASYTVQEDMFKPCMASDQTQCKGGPAEPRGCVYPTHKTVFGNTIWSAYEADHWGRLQLQASGSGFNAIIGVVPFKDVNDAAPAMGEYICFVNRTGSGASATIVVKPKQWYAIQAGGSNGAFDAAAGGPLKVTFGLLQPARVKATGILTWKANPLRINRFYIQDPPSGLHISLTCTKQACEPSSATVKPGQVSAAKRRYLLRNTKVKRGATIVLRLTAYGKIGKYMRWDVKRDKIGPPVVRCLNPESKTPRKSCRGFDPDPYA